MRPADFLAHYAAQFPTVEADVTYYRVPGTGMVRGWDRKTPETFILSAKFPRAIVHAGDSRRPDPEKILVAETVWQETRMFLDAMDGLGHKCGPLVLQFPYFARSVFAEPMEFLARLDRFLERLPGRFRYAVEVRNRNWIAEPLLEVLRRHGAALVLADLPYMPHPEDLPGQINLLTADFAYIRLIGDRRAVEARTRTFDRIVIDRLPRLERWAGFIRHLMERTGTVFVYANNHFAGHAPATIGRLADLVLSV